MPLRDRTDRAGERDPSSRPGHSPSSATPAPPRPLAAHADHRRKSSGASSGSHHPPPAPPSDFNPPADLSFEQPLHGIQPPDEPSDPFATAAAYAADLAIDASWTPPPPPLTDVDVKSFPQRPQIRAIQRLSSDSVLRNRALSGTSSTHSSDSGEILAARRDELVSHILSDSADSTRRASAASSSPGVEVEPHLDENAPTPNASCANLADRALAEVDAELSSPSLDAEDGTRPRHASGSADELLHAWDSVVSRRDTQ